MTCVRGDDSWWRRRRPPKLNRRQHANANAVKHALSELGWATWLAHIDADEVLSADRAVLAGLDPGVAAVRFEVWEVATDGTPVAHDDQVWFKRLLTSDGLRLLTELGIIRRPHNQAYFHGHVVGKSGVRPTSPGWLTCHDVLDLDNEKMPAAADHRLRVLHLESADVVEFERKWRALLDAAAPPTLRPSREALAAALRGLFARSSGRVEGAVRP